MNIWQGRIDTADGELGQRWHQIMRPTDAATPARRGGVARFCV